MWFKIYLFSKAVTSFPNGANVFLWRSLLQSSLPLVIWRASHTAWLCGYSGTSLTGPRPPQVAQWGRIHLLMQATRDAQVRSLGREDPLEKGGAAHSSVQAWGIHGQGAWWATVHGVTSRTWHHAQTTPATAHWPVRFWMGRDHALHISGIHSTVYVLPQL